METPLLRLGETDSTSAEARRRFEAGEDGPLWILAERQTAGYGRRGRGWQSPPGNLYATLLWPLDRPLGTEGPAGYSFAAALAVAGACVQSGAAAGLVSLKWPNDVLLSGRKLSGLLVELLTAQDRTALAIGIGVNLARAPRVPDYETAALSEVAPPPEPAAFAVRLDERFAHYLALWSQAGFGALRRAWLAQAEGLGRAVTVRLPCETLEGVFEDLAADGALLLRRGEGVVTVTAGDVFFPRRRG